MERRTSSYFYFQTELLSQLEFSKTCVSYANCWWFFTTLHTKSARFIYSFAEYILISTCYALCYFSNCSLTLFLNQVKYFIDDNKATYTRDKPKTENLQNMGSQTPPNPLGIGTTWVHLRKIRDRKLLLDWAKLVSTPSKVLLFLSFQMIHINAKAVLFQALCLILIAPLFQLNNNSFNHHRSR